MELVYRIDHDLATLGGYGLRQLKSLPLEELDFQALASSHAGVVLQRYRQRDKNEYREITARLRFDSVAVFNNFFDTSGSIPLQLKITANESDGQLFFPLTSAVPASENAVVQQLQQQFAREFFSANSVNLKMVAPQRITQFSDGQAKGKRAETTYQLSELITANTDIIWRVNW